MFERKPFSLLLLIFVIALVGSYFIYDYWYDKASNELVQSYYSNVKKDVIQTSVVEKKVKKIDKEEYLGILRIPKINLRLGFYKINSSNNNVNKNIQLLKGSDMPDKNGGTLIIAGHSGTGYLAFFKNIDKLIIGDKMMIDYQKVQYEYIINNIYEMKKNGKIEINKNINENYLVLTTCSKNKDKQLIITGKLLNKI